MERPALRPATSIIQRPSSGPTIRANASIRPQAVATPSAFFPVLSICSSATRFRPAESNGYAIGIRAVEVSAGLT